MKLPLDGQHNIPDNLKNKENELTVDVNVNPKLDFKAALKDKALRFKSFVIGAKIHKEFDQDDVSMDIEVSVDLQKMNKEQNDEALKKASIMFSKKF